MNSGTESDLDSKPDDYILLCRACSHCADSDSHPYPDPVATFLGQICVPGLESESVFGNVNNP